MKTGFCVVKLLSECTFSVSVLLLDEKKLSSKYQEILYAFYWFKKFLWRRNRNNNAFKNSLYISSNFTHNLFLLFFGSLFHSIFSLFFRSQMDMKRILVRMRKAQANIGDWILLYKVNNNYNVWLLFKRTEYLQFRK